LQNGIATIFVNPKNTSKKCPKCNNELKEYNGNLHYLECKQCEFKDGRDHIAIANITKKSKDLLLNLKGQGRRSRNSTQNLPPSIIYAMRLLSKKAMR
jgi:transposase